MGPFGGTKVIRVESAVFSFIYLFYFNGVYLLYKVVLVATVLQI